MKNTGLFDRITDDIQTVYLVEYTCCELVGNPGVRLMKCNSYHAKLSDE